MAIQSRRPTALTYSSSAWTCPNSTCPRRTRCSWRRWPCRPARSRQSATVRSSSPKAATIGLDRTAVAEQGDHDGHQVGGLLEAVERGVAGGGEGAAAGRCSGSAVPCGYGCGCCRGRVALVRGSRGCGRIGPAGPSVSLPGHGLATMPGGMLGGPAFFKPLPLGSRFNGVLPNRQRRLASPDGSVSSRAYFHQYRPPGPKRSALSQWGWRSSRGCHPGDRGGGRPRACPRGGRDHGRPVPLAWRDRSPSGSTRASLTRSGAMRRSRIGRRGTNIRFRERKSERNFVTVPCRGRLQRERWHARW